MISSNTERIYHMTIGEKITKLRKDQNLTQEQLAEILNVSRQSVSKWEQNITYPDTDKLIRMGKLFNCSLDFLLKDEIERMDINVVSANEEGKYNKIYALILTYLSFPPLFGWLVGIFSLNFQKKHMDNKMQIGLTIFGISFSAILTILMIVGVALGL